MKHDSPRFLAATLLAIAALSSCVAPRQEDPYQVKIPPGLREQLARKFPGDRLPTMGDSRKEDIEENVKQGGDGCLLIASGDFDGNRLEDAALILFSKEGRRLRLVAALKEGETWQLDSLSTWDGSDDNPYIHPLIPGDYTRTKALEGPATQPGEKTFISSKLAGFVHGTIESSGCAYFHINGKWSHVWLSD